MTKLRKYFFGYLFVRIAKLLAIITLLVGLGWMASKYVQTSIAADSASYRPSELLRQQLERLGETFISTRELVGEFAGPGSGAKEVVAPRFARVIHSDGDFERLTEELGVAERGQQELKQKIVASFEDLTEKIEQKLRAHAASLEPPPAPAASGVTPAATPSPALTPSTVPEAEDAETLFSKNLSRMDVLSRSADLERTKQLLKLLEGMAENPDNRRILTESAAQIDALSTLLPKIRPDPTPVSQFNQSPPSSQPVPSATPRPPPLNAEKMADQLGRMRATVRATVLSSWSLDEVLGQASETAAVERGGCRVASLTVKGIWLGGLGQIGLALVGALFIAFLILVFADLTQTLLDTTKVPSKNS